MDTLHGTKSEKLLIRFGDGGSASQSLTKSLHRLFQFSLKLQHLLFYSDLEVLTAVSLITFGR